MKPRLGLVTLLPLFFCSGAAGLGQQMVWVRMFSAGLGHEVPAVFAVTAAFLGGMACGSWLLSERIEQRGTGGSWYGALELGIGAWAACSAWFIPVLNDWVLHLTGPAPSPLRQWLIVFAIPSVALLPATAAMGGTLPAMERFFSEVSRAFAGRTFAISRLSLRARSERVEGRPRCVGTAYAANTAGAVLGILGGAFGLMPLLGFRRSLLALAAVNGLCGVAALLLDRWANRRSAAGVSPQAAATSTRREMEPATSSAARRPPRAGSGVLSEEPHAIPQRRIHAILFVSGLLGIGLELAGIRLLSQLLENTLYTFAAVLAIYLVGTALGAALYQRWGGGSEFAVTASALLGGAAVASMVCAHVGRVLHPFYDRLRHGWGDGFAAVAGAEMVIAACVFLVPTVMAGALFSHLVQSQAGDPRGLGRAVAWNTLGCAAAAVVFGLWLIPGLGVKWSLVAVATGYLLLIPRVREVAAARAAMALSLALVIVLPAGGLRLVDLPPGARLQDYREGIMAAVAVVRTTDGQRSLRVNNRLQMGGTAAALAERRQAHLPLLLHRDPRSALFLGPGTGITLGAAAVYPGLNSDGVELVPEVVKVMGAFEPENNSARFRVNIQLQTADARRFVRTTPNRYDVIVADLFHPAQDGAGFLYTREHYQAVRHCLNAGGLFCQWLPLHQLDDAGLRSILRTFLDVFPQTQAVLLHFNVDIPVLGLIGTERPWHWSAAQLEQRLAIPRAQEALRQAGLDKAIQVLGCWVGGPAALSRYAQTGDLSTDDRPVILFEAARQAARRDAPAPATLMNFLASVPDDPRAFAAESIEGGGGTFAEHLADFIAARNLYLSGLVEEGAGRLHAAIDLYLESTKRSVYFTASYARCVTIIQVLAATDRDQGRALFRRLETAQPAQPLGRKLLGPLLE